MKKIYTVLLVAICFAFFSTPLLAGEYFSDVNENDWFYEEVNSAYELGLVNGVSETHFSPYSQITRGMFVTILGRMDGFNPYYYSWYYTDSDYFKDVDRNKYYAPYITWAYENDIVDGTGLNTFSPDAPITREQIAKMLDGYIEYAKYDIPYSDNAISHFSDEDNISSWAKMGMNTMRQYGIIQGDDLQRCNPQKSCNRAEGTAMILRLFTMTTDCDLQNGYNVVSFAGSYDIYDSFGGEYCTHPDSFDYWQDVFIDYLSKKEFVAAVIPCVFDNQLFFAGLIQWQGHDECYTVRLVLLDENYDFYGKAELDSVGALRGLCSIKTFYVDDGIFIFIDNQTHSEYVVHDMIHFTTEGYYIESFDTEDIYQFRLENDVLYKRFSYFAGEMGDDDYRLILGDWKPISFSSFYHVPFN